MPCMRLPWPALHCIAQANSVGSSSTRQDEHGTLCTTRVPPTPRRIAMRRGSEAPTSITEK